MYINKKIFELLLIIIVLAIIYYVQAKIGFSIIND